MSSPAGNPNPVGSHYGSYGERDEKGRLKPLPNRPPPPKKRTVWRPPAGSGPAIRDLNDLWFLHELRRACDADGMPRALYLAMQAAFYEGARQHVAHLLNRPDADRREHAARALDYIDDQRAMIRDEQADDHGKHAFGPLGEKIRHRLNKRWLLAADGPDGQKRD